MTIAPGRALVVGNTDGIGLALTKRLVGAGWTVVGVSRRASVFASARHQHVVLDVSAPDASSRLRSVQASHPPFDVCVYCAGVGDLLNVDDLLREGDVFRVNVLGAVATATAVLPSMIAAGRGHLLCLSSIGDGMSHATFHHDRRRAVDVIWRCLDRKPARMTTPKRMAALAWDGLVG